MRATLNETLRHDYGPERSRAYFEECKVRLSVVEQALEDDPKMDRETVADHMRSLGSLGSRISLIERSHLGEFSWPFANVIEQIAERLFVEKALGSDEKPIIIKPIVHVVAEGADYQIVDDEVPPPGVHRIVIVAFPRQLKQHVLLHAIFGHELAHTAMRTEESGNIMTTSVLPLTKCGPLQDAIQIKAWLSSKIAPVAIRARVCESEFEFLDQWLENWRQEIVCDLFGLLLFGPAFAAAHRTIIEPLCPGPEAFDLESTTHPPYPIRQRILAIAIHAMKWDKPVTRKADGVVHQAELAFLSYVTAGPSAAWFEIFSEAQICKILDALKGVLTPYNLIYISPDRKLICGLVLRLSEERPPISQSIDNDGVPTNHYVSSAHCLYAGWSYWFGRSSLAKEARRRDAHVQELSFLEVNRLCDQALLQQRAIDLVNDPTRQAPSAEAK